MEEWIRNALPRILLHGWIEEEGIDGSRYLHRKSQTSVIISGCVELDGKRWIHFSVARKDHLPHWEELVDIKEMFLGRETKAIQVIPPRSQYVNIHPNCLHLWYCVDGDPLPDFTRGGKSL